MTEAKAMKPKKRRLASFLYKRGWCTKVPRSGIRHRVWALAADRHHWYDWGHRLMILVGQDQSGNWSEPSPPTWWYRQGPSKRMLRTGYPRHPLSTYEVVKDYETFRSLTEGLHPDKLYEWQAINANQDGDLQLGHRYWGGEFYGLSHWDVPLLRKYLRAWRRLDWWGLRSWLYTQGLHAAVHQRKPRSCQVTPPKGSGGYSHWYCGLKRRHAGPHRYGNYEWDPTKPRVEFAPIDQVPG